MWFKLLDYPGSHFGWVGVDLFFVLSGFLVGGVIIKSYKKSNTFSPGRFMTRRAWKIVPQLYVFLCVMTFTHPSAARLWIPSWLTLQNYLDSPAKHLWSLAVEEHFYLITPLALGLLLWFRPLCPRVVGLASLAIGVICLLSRSLIVFSGYPPSLSMLATHNRIDALLFGDFLAGLYHLAKPTWDRLASQKLLLLAPIAAALLVLAMFDKYSPMEITVGLTLNYIAAGACVILCTEFKLPGGILKPVIGSVAWVGERSYGIYLWQFLLGTRLANLLAGMGAKRGLGDEVVNLLRFSGWILGAYLLGIGTYYIIELPALRIRDRLFPSPAMA